MGSRLEYAKLIKVKGEEDAENATGHEDEEKICQEIRRRRRCSGVLKNGGIRMGLEEQFEKTEIM